MQLFILLFLPKFIITIAVIVLIYYGIKLFTRYVLPLLLDKKIKDMQQKMHEQQRQQQSPNRNEGDVTIEYNQRKNKNRNQSDGEYIDFEEVD